MKFSTRGRYALRLMIDIAQNEEGGYVALKDVAGRQEISVKYLEQIITKLSKAGLISSLRGCTGGYKTTKDPKEYTAGEILRAAEGNLVTVDCLKDEKNNCSRCITCSTLGFWDDFSKVMNDFADSVTLFDLMQGAKV